MEWACTARQRVCEFRLTDILLCLCLQTFLMRSCPFKVRARPPSALPVPRSARGINIPRPEILNCDLIECMGIVRSWTRSPEYSEIGLRGMGDGALG